jgi:hypothetical protein
MNYNKYLGSSETAKSGCSIEFNTQGVNKVTYFSLKNGPISQK